MPAGRKYTWRRNPARKGTRRVGKKTNKLKSQIGRKINNIPMPKQFRFVRTAIARTVIDTENGMTNGFMSIPLKVKLEDCIQEYSNFQTLFRTCRVAGARFEITIDRNYSASAYSGYPNIMMKIIPARLVINSDNNPITWLEAQNIRASGKTKYLCVDQKYPTKQWLNGYVMEGYPHGAGDTSAINIVRRCPYLDMTTNKDQDISFGHLLLQTSSFANFSANYDPVITVTQFTYFTCAGQTF